MAGTCHCLKDVGFQLFCFSSEMWAVIKIPLGWVVCYVLFKIVDVIHRNQGNGGNNETSQFRFTPQHLLLSKYVEVALFSSIIECGKKSNLELSAHFCQRSERSVKEDRV